ncbi:MAG: flagella basal body P-ring formation protein FlgA [Terriglobales bacterium]
MIRVIRQLIVLLALCAVVCAATAAPVDHGRVAVSRDQLASTLRSGGYDVNPAQLQLLSNVSSRAGVTPHLTKVVEESRGNALAEFNCPPRECLPFYVLLHDVHMAARVPPALDRGTAATAETRPLIARGKPVILLLEGSDCRITVPAISLERGTRGQVIKVTSLDHKRIFQAEVVSGTTVRSTL